MAATLPAGLGASRPAGLPRFRARIQHAPRLASWHRGCPVRRSALRLLRLRYVGFDGRAHRGKLVVARRWARPVVRVFRKLYAARFPIRRLKLVEAYGSNDDRVDLADDTSGFNCRYVGGTHVWSEHAYGRAIDVDPLENPEISHGRVSNRRYRPYRNRSRRRPGMIHAGDVVVRAFASIGWRWGGSWHEPRDYQHFSATGR